MSHILSFGGHLYYGLIFYDFMIFLWNFPISNKSQVHFIFPQFRSHIKIQVER